MIEFTQFLRPNGRKRIALIDRPENIENMAKELQEKDWRFEIEELMTGKISMEIWKENGRGESLVLSSEICENNPEVLNTVDKLIKDAFENESKNLVAEE